MVARAWFRERGRGKLCLALVLVFSLSLAIGGVGRIVKAAPAIQEKSAFVRLVHGVADAGPLDIYVDGALALIGIVFGESSGALTVPAGEHEFTVVPTGATLDEALVDGAINLRDGTESYAAILGTSEATSVGLFRVDTRPLEAGRARFRIISGVPDAGAIVPVFSGGEALTEPLGFGDSSEYALLDAGTYDLDMLDEATGASILALPGTEFAEGTTTDVMLIGQITDGTLAPLVTSVPVEVQRPIGRTAQIASGTCLATGELIADLGLVQPGQGGAVGAAGATGVAQGFGLAPVAFATLVDTPHVVIVAEDQEAGGAVVACGEIGGQLTETGALVIALRSAASNEPAGVVVLAPGLENPDTTGASTFLIGGRSNAPSPGTPAPGGG